MSQGGRTHGFAPTDVKTSRIKIFSWPYKLLILNKEDTVGKQTDDMTRLVGEVRTWDEHRTNFIKAVQNRVKQCAEETRGMIAGFRNDMEGAHSAFCGRKTAHHKR